MNTIIEKIGKVFLGIGAFIGVLFVVFMSGKKTERNNQEIEDLRDEIDTAKRIQAAKPAPDRATAVQRLRERGQLRD